MSNTPDDNRPLHHHVLSHFQRNQGQWERLRTYISYAKEMPGEDRARITDLKKKKNFLQRPIRKNLARLRRRYRKTYQTTAENIVKEWRPEFERRLARAKPYQRDISRLIKRENRALQTLHTTIKKINTVLRRFAR